MPPAARPPPRSRAATPPIGRRDHRRGDVRRRIAAEPGPDGERHRDHADPGDDERDASHDDGNGRGRRRLAQVAGGERRRCARPRAPAAEAARIGRLVVIGDGLYAERRRDSAATAVYSPRCRSRCPSIRATERRPRITRWVSFGFAPCSLIGLVAYFAYIGYEASRQLAEPQRQRRLPHAGALGWAYEAINYDIATDAALTEQARPEGCATQGAPPGDERSTSPDGVRLAGWYDSGRDRGSGHRADRGACARLEQQQERPARPGGDPARRTTTS